MTERRQPQEVLTLQLAADGTRTYRDPEGNQLVLPALQVQRENLRTGRMYQMPEGQITLANGERVEVGYYRAEHAINRHTPLTLESAREVLGQGLERALGVLGVGDGASTREITVPADTIERIAQQEKARQR